MMPFFTAASAAIAISSSVPPWALIAASEAATYHQDYMLLKVETPSAGI